jgi:4,5-dihydroxyphthalate decarboxylase
VRTYAQTTGLWVRGILQHEYGVDLDKVTWMTVGDGHLAEYNDPPNCVRLPKGSDIGQMILDGDLAATLQGVDLPKDPRVERLIPDPMNAARQWYDRVGVVPINHMFVVHEDLSLSGIVQMSPVGIVPVFSIIVQVATFPSGPTVTRARSRAAT